MPTSKKVKHRFLQALPKEMTGTIFELGAGWGTLAIPLAKRYPKCQVIALENSWIPFLVCKLRLRLSGLNNLQILRKDFFKASFREANLIVCYLHPGAMQKLKTKFQTEISQMTLIATHTFSISGWTPVHTEVINDLYSTHIYHYTKF